MSYPPALDLPRLWSDDIDGYRIGDLSHNDMYRRAIRSKETVFTFLGKDLQFDEVP